MRMRNLSKGEYMEVKKIIKKLEKNYLITVDDYKLY